jgi:hypothetical protein
MLTQYWQTCPNCRQRIDLDLALGYSGWSKLAPLDCGIRCPNCKMILAARQRPGLALLWAIMATVLALMFFGQEAGRLSRTAIGVMGFGLMIIALFIRRWRLRSIELSVPPPGVKLREVTPSAREYAYREGRHRRDKAFEPDPTRTGEELPEWVCPNCKQSNPSGFDVCWKCNHGRPESRTGQAMSR